MPSQDMYHVRLHAASSSLSSMPPQVEIGGGASVFAVIAWNRYQMEQDTNMGERVRHAHVQPAQHEHDNNDLTLLEAEQARFQIDRVYSHAKTLTKEDLECEEKLFLGPDAGSWDLGDYLLLGLPELPKGDTGLSDLDNEHPF